MKKTLLTTALVCGLVIFGLGTQTASAAPKAGKAKVVIIVKPPPKPRPKPPIHKNAPIDGGVSLLVGAGIAYGIKKAYTSRKKVTQ